MDIQLDKLGKRFESGWVLRNISIKIPTGKKLAITGPNGSGKSTLVQLISGYLTPSEGEIIYRKLDQDISRDNFYKHVSISAAYMELDEELSPRELFSHYKIFKPLLVKDFNTFINEVELIHEADKQIRYFSSGMKQRLSLGLSIMMDVDTLFLDEPTSFLDDSKKNWFRKILAKYSKGKTVVIASNDSFDLEGCELSLELSQ